MRKLMAVLVLCSLQAKAEMSIDQITEVTATLCPVKGKVMECRKVKMVALPKGAKEGDVVVDGKLYKAKAIRQAVKQAREDAK